MNRYEKIIQQAQCDLKVLVSNLTLETPKDAVVIAACLIAKAEQLLIQAKGRKYATYVLSVEADRLARRETTL